jgi:hypothetical protein
MPGSWRAYEHPDFRVARKAHLWAEGATWHSSRPVCGARISRRNTRKIIQPMDSSRCCSGCLVSGITGVDYGKVAPDA